MRTVGIRSLRRSDTNVRWPFGKSSLRVVGYTRLFARRIRMVLHLGLEWSSFSEADRSSMAGVADGGLTER